MCILYHIFGEKSMIFLKIVNQSKPKSQFLYKTANVLFASAQEAEKALFTKQKKTSPETDGETARAGDVCADLLNN